MMENSAESSIAENKIDPADTMEEVDSEIRESRIPEQDNDSADVTEPLRANTESVDPSASGCEPTTKSESEKQLRMFVTLLTARVMNKCNSLKNRSQEIVVAHMKSLINQTMEGLTVPEGFCIDIKGVKKVSKAVMKDLLKTFCSKGVLETLISLEDPVVDKAIVQCLQAHIRSYSAKLAKNATPHSWWKDALHMFAFTAGLLIFIALIAFVPI